MEQRARDRDREREKESKKMKKIREPQREERVQNDSDKRAMMENNVTIKH